MSATALPGQDSSSSSSSWSCCCCCFCCCCCAQVIRASVAYCLSVVELARSFSLARDWAWPDSNITQPLSHSLSLSLCLSNLIFAFFPPAAHVRLIYIFVASSVARHLPAKLSAYLEFNLSQLDASFKCHAPLYTSI